MKKIKLLLKLQSFFNHEQKKDENYVKELKSILRKLKKKELNLIAALDALKNQDSELLKLYQTELEIIRKQRKKGLDALQEIRSQVKRT